MQGLVLKACSRGEFRIFDQYCTPGRERERERKRRRVHAGSSGRYYRSIAVISQLSQLYRSYIAATSQLHRVAPLRRHIYFKTDSSVKFLRRRSYIAITSQLHRSYIAATSQGGGGVQKKNMWQILIQYSIHIASEKRFFSTMSCTAALIPPNQPPN